MRHRASRKFWQHFGQLPAPVQTLARKNYQLLKQDPTHPSLHFKQVRRYWSVRVGLNHRALAIQSGHDLVWLWIGSHAEYNALIKR